MNDFFFLKLLFQLKLKHDPIEPGEKKIAPLKDQHFFASGSAKHRLKCTSTGFKSRLSYLRTEAADGVEKKIEPHSKRFLHRGSSAVEEM